MARRTALGALSGAVVLLAACAGTLSDPETPPPGSSPGFRDGYVDGCATGFQDAGRDGFQQAGRKDMRRYLTEGDYRSGFVAGSGACYEEEKRHPRTPQLG